MRYTPSYSIYIALKNSRYVDVRTYDEHRDNNDTAFFTTQADVAILCNQPSCAAQQTGEREVQAEPASLTRAFTIDSGSCVLIAFLSIPLLES